MTSRTGELVLVAIAAAGLVWTLQSEQASLPMAEQWAQKLIASGKAPASARSDMEKAYRAAYGSEDSHGRYAAYPDSRDGYYFLRLARSIAETGTPCADSLSRSVCRDTLVIPPVGRPMIDATSPHPWAIALVYKAMRAVDPQASLLAAGRLHTSLMLVVCALLSYLAVRSMAPLGARSAGLAAALALLLTPIVIQRAFGADDDVWILALMLAVLLGAERFLTAATEGGWRPLAALTTGAATGLLAATWGGWPFTAIMVACVAPLALGEALRHSAERWRRVGAVTGSFTLAVMGFIAVVLTLAPGLLAIGKAPGPALGGLPPPDSFATVGELTVPDLAGATRLLGWPSLVAAAIGLMAVIRRLWPWARQGFPAGPLLLLAWTVGGLILAPRAERFLLLLAPPLALLAGLGIGALPELVRPSAIKSAAAPLAAAALLAGLAPQALSAVERQHPALSTAWVSVLSELARTTPRDAILVTWWDTGHWATYWARRPVAVDGASLQNPRIHDVGRLLAADADQPLDRLLSQAACGSPDDCGHPVYLLTSSALLGQQGWMISGFWQPIRAQAADRVRAGDLPPGLSAPLLAQARALRTRLDRARFAAPQAVRWSTRWAPCRVAADGSYDCPLHLPSASGLQIERFVMPDGQAARGRLVLRDAGSGRSILLTPSLLRLATLDRLLDITGEAPADNPGVLLDQVKRRAFVGSPGVLRSLVTQLVLLDGRYQREHFELVAAATTPEGDKVRAWRWRPRR